jgi:DNA-binding SARP family transcriptional activator
VPLGGNRERALLARLLISAGQVVASDRLVDDLWDSDPADGSLASLQVYVSRLRRALRQAGAAELLVTQNPGYVLRVEPGSVDAGRFERLVAEGRRRLAAGDPEAADILRRATDLWRGPALVEVRDMPFARAEAARLDEGRLAAIETRIEADLAAGRHAELSGELAALVDAHPLRERLWALRMLALYRAGRQADALRAYQELRKLLADELGLDPNPELARLEAEILRHDPSLAWRGCAPPPAGQPGLSAPTPLPPPLRWDQPSPVVGRASELDRLATAWKEACSGQPRLVLVAGEPGVGKTRLAIEAARQVHDDGATVLFGRCDEGLGVPYQPFVEALSTYVRQAPQPRLGRLPGELTRLVPELAERVEGLPLPLRSDPETERYRLMDAVAAWLAATSEEAPTLFLLDDLHWATQPTLLLLRHLVHTAEPLRTLIVATYRDTTPDFTSTVADAIGGLLGQPGVTRLALCGLDEDGVEAYIASRAGQALDESARALARAVHAETAGNPFFVGQAIRHLAETGGVVRRDGRWTAWPVRDLSIPDDVRDVVGRRLAHLPEPTRQILTLAAVAGEHFELAPLLEAAGLPEPAMVEALDPAIAARLVVEVPGAALGYRFVHALVRATIYDALPGARRAALHRQTGRALEAVHAGRLESQLPALARHFVNAAAGGDVDDGVKYATQAGDYALAQLANSEAVVYYEQALKLLDRSPAAAPGRLEVLIRLGEAQKRSGDPRHRPTLLEACRLAPERGDTETFARAVLALQRIGTMSLIGLVDDEMVAVLQSALAAVGPADSSTAARLRAQLAIELLFAGDRARCDALSGEAVAIARRLGDPATLAAVLIPRFTVIWDASTLTERRAIASELIAAAKEARNPYLEFWGCRQAAAAAWEAADPAAVTRHWAAAEELADELNQPMLRWFQAIYSAARAVGAGRLADAERLTFTAREIASAAGFPDSSIVFTFSLFMVRSEQGRLDEFLDEWLAFAPRLPTVSLTHAVTAFIHAELGLLDEARRALRTTEAAGSIVVAPSTFNLDLLSNALNAVTCARLGDQVRSRQLWDALLPYADHLVVQTVIGLGAVNHYLGLLATTLEQFDEADRRFAAAAATHTRVGAPGWAARTRLEWARMLGRRGAPGDQERARELAAQARAVAAELGLAGVAQGAEALLPAP